MRSNLETVKFRTVLFDVGGWHGPFHVSDVLVFSDRPDWDEVDKKRDRLGYFTYRPRMR